MSVRFTLRDEPGGTRLAALEASVPLFDECGHAFLGVRAREKLAERVGLGLEVLGVVALESVVDRGLGRGDRERALRRDRARDLERLLDQLARLEDAVDEADAE